MIPGEDCSDDDEYYGVNPYESFMKRHLQHYGYYTERIYKFQVEDEDDSFGGKNQNYKNQFQQYAEWEKNYAYNLSSSGSDSDSDSDDDDKNDEQATSEPCSPREFIHATHPKPPQSRTPNGANRREQIRLTLERISETEDLKAQVCV